MTGMPGFHTLKDLPLERVTDKVSRRVLTGEKGMMIWWYWKAGAHVEPHVHPHEQLVWVLSGKVELRAGRERRTCGPGDLAVVPGGIEHEAWFIDDTEVIDVFAPPREDLLTPARPGYLREE